MSADEVKRNTRENQVGVPDTIAIKKVRVSELNPRSSGEYDVSSLVTSIDPEAGMGLLQPLVLRRRPDGTFEVVVGARRFKALKAIRGEDGVLHAGEYRIVEWSDDECVRAAMAENREREDLSPVDEGRFLNVLAGNLKGRDEEATDEALEKKTAIDRSRISDLRALATKLDLLPKAWREQLSRPANRRSGDTAAGDVTLTATHWKYVRGRVKKTIPPEVVEIMEQAVTGRWTSAKFKAALEALDAKSNPADAGGGNGNTPPAAPPPEPKPGAAITAGKQVAKSLRTAATKLQPLDKFTDLSEQFNALIDEIEKRVNELVAKRDADKKGKGKDGDE